MTTGETLIQLLTGGLLGLTGQGLRVVVGLKKLNDQAQQTNQKTKDLIVTSQLLISLLIGFFAGILATVSMLATGDGKPLSNHALLSMIAAGYAGTDFIEAFMNKAQPDLSAIGNAGGPPPQGASPQPTK